MLDYTAKKLKKEIDALEDVISKLSNDDEISSLQELLENKRRLFDIFTKDVVFSTDWIAGKEFILRIASGYNNRDIYYLDTENTNVPKDVWELLSVNHFILLRDENIPSDSKDYLKCVYVNGDYSDKYVTFHTEHFDILLKFIDLYKPKFKFDESVQVRFDQLLILFKLSNQP